MVLTGNEKAFAAGADIKAMRDWGYMDVYKSDYITAEWEAVTRCRKPRSTAIHSAFVMTRGMMSKGIRRSVDSLSP